MSRLALVPRASTRSYHHGRLREAVVEAAVKEVELVGPAGLSMREVARRAGVSHAAPAHHFGDKAGLFTAIATEGYQLLEQATRDATAGDNALLQGGLAYIRFALTHRPYFEVMFRPDLYRSDDAELLAARDAAFNVLFEAVAHALPYGDPNEVLATAIAAWSQAHGLAVLWTNRNFPQALTDDAHDLAALAASGLARLGDITRRQMTAVLATLPTAPSSPRVRPKQRGRAPKARR